MKTHGRTSRRRKLRILKDSSQILHRNVYLLTKWMCSNGYEPAKKLKPKIFDGTGRGLMAYEAIYPADVILAIPQNLLITPSSVLGSCFGPLIKKYCPEATGHCILSIFLMYEKAKGTASTYYHYISSLPKSYIMSPYFCDHTFTLMPKSVYMEAMQQYELVNNMYHFIKPLLENLKDDFTDILSFDLFKWAWCSVNTRSIFMKCEDEHCQGKMCTYHLALAPLLDLLNHTGDVKVTAGFNREKKCFQLTSHAKFKKYSQVFINYGQHDNKKLCLEYGFIVPNNCDDFVAFSLDDIIACCKLLPFEINGLSNRLKFITDNNLLKNAVCSIEGLSWNLSIVLKILTSAYDPKLWSSLLFQNDQSCNLDFKRLKECLMKLKMANYSLNLPTQYCSLECNAQLHLISALCAAHLSLLSHGLE